MVQQLLNQAALTQKHVTTTFKIDGTVYSFEDVAKEMKWKCA